MRQIQIEPMSAEAFAPYGHVLPPAEIGRKVELIEQLRNLRGSARARLGLTALAPTSLPMTITQLERHAFSSQAFVPTECETYLVMVAPKGADGMPDVAGLRAFRVPGTTGIIYGADVWHHPMTVLNAPAHFVSVTFVDGTAADDEFAQLETPLAITD